MKIQGKALKLGDNINTDFIISGRYKFSITDIRELSKHLMEDIDLDFPNKIVRGKTIIVAGENFGMGSSREQAPLVIKESGIVAILAKTFARIFYRNSFNIGLALFETDTQKIEENDALIINMDKGVADNLTKGSLLNIKPLPKFMQELLEYGGIVNYFKKTGGLPI